MASSSSSSAGERVRFAKLSARPEIEIEEWARRGYAQSLSLDTNDVVDSIQRIDARTTSREEFIAMHADRPAVLTHVADSWAASSHWTSPEALCKRCQGGHLRVGCTPDGQAVTLTMEDFVAYCNGLEGGDRDDSPLYVFDWDFAEESSATHSLLGDYEVPGAILTLINAD